MPLTLTWPQISQMLGLSALVGGMTGFDLGEHGPAGLRTTLLVCLGASVAMIEANLLLSTAGKAPDPFASLVVMRLSLGILTGMGFIGSWRACVFGSGLVEQQMKAAMYFSTRPNISEGECSTV